MNSPTQPPVDTCKEAAAAACNEPMEEPLWNPHTTPPTPPAARESGTISFHLKTSIFTRRVTIGVDKMALGLIKQLAVAFVEELYFQDASLVETSLGQYLRRNFKSAESRAELRQRLLLRKYDYHHETFLPFNSASDIEPESFISIELSERRPASSTSALATAPAIQATSTTSPLSTTTAATTSQSEAAAATTTGGRIRLSHEFKAKSYFFITICSSCNQVIKGLFRQGYQCGSCSRNFCPKCKQHAEQAGEACLPATCLGPPVQAHFFEEETPQGAAAVDELAKRKAMLATVYGKPSDATRLNTKRKSASNLVTDLTPFADARIDAGHRGAPETATRTGGALEPVLQQLSKNLMRSTAAVAEEKPQHQLTVAQQAHLSSSHQNLSGGGAQTGGCGREPATDDLDAGQLQTGVVGGGGQLCTSARASALDLVCPVATRASLRSRDRNHAFVSMGPEWALEEPALAEALCGVCSKPLLPQTKQSQATSQLPAAPSKCTRCKLQLHLQCQGLVLADCLSRITESSRAAARESACEPDSEPNNKGRLSARSPSNASTTNNNNNNTRGAENIRLHRLAPSVKHLKRPDTSKPIIEGWLRHTTLSDERARQHYWRLDHQDLTLYENETSTRYFRAIALDKITRVMSASALPKRVREEILMAGGSTNEQDQELAVASANQVSSKSASSSPQRKAPEFDEKMNAMFAFELSTGSMFLVQASSSSEASRWRDTLDTVMKALAAPPEAGRPQPEAATESPVVAAPAPAPTSGQVSEPAPPAAVEPQQLQRLEVEEVGVQETALRPKQPPQRNHRAHHQYNGGPVNLSSRRAFTDASRSRLYNRPRKTIQVDPMAVPDHYIKGKYLIEQDRAKGYGFVELGSGQFGKVYAAISELKAEDTSKGLWSGVPVAIKEISKARFDLRQQAKLKNEANILAQLDHPGVIILERVHDLEDKIYIVMEQLEDDMLEMIVSTEEKRLNERVTKFLTYQILEALKYLHAKNIAHCDLKPENVLLVERRSQFPQIKLCDFGFAKIIEDNSFRSSLVGTPAYLAPEVVKGEKYNRSVDLWSVGVIVYVSLSGEFPFNEGENIHDQISRANFMYPEQPWAKISGQAKRFIDSLLRVNCEHRLSASRAQMDNWIQDFQLWCDLSDLEVRVGKRWVTDDADFERWTRFARKQGLQVPRSALQLHDELLAD